MTRIWLFGHAASPASPHGCAGSPRARAEFAHSRYAGVLFDTVSFMETRK
jgi:hypothetical protein